MVPLLVAAALIPAQADSLVVTVEDAVARAIVVSPIVAAADGAIRAPRGERAEAFWPFPDNPSIEYGRVRRRASGSTVYDRQWTVTQKVEIGGQWIFRASAAGRRLRAQEELAVDARRRVGLEARLAYLALAIAERRSALTDSNAVFAERLSEFARLQLDAGEINRLEYNVAVLEAARARSEAERTRAEHSAAASDLGRLLAVEPGTIPRTASLPQAPDLGALDEATLLALARDRRADLASARSAEEAADRTLTAARLSFIPNLTISAFSGRDEGTDNLLGFGIGFTVPLFHRGQTARGVAEADRSLARAAFTATERRIRAEVIAVRQRFLRARASERRFATDVLRAATENVTLTQTALAEGEVSVTEVVVLRSAAVAAQLEYLNVLTDAAASWFELAATLNATPAELAELLR